MICKECGAENRDEIPFCANCGTELPSHPKKYTWKLLLAAGILILLTAVLLTYLLSPASYERDAKRFVKAVLQNDMDTVEELMVPSVYAYAGSSLDLGKGVESCRVRLRSTEAMPSVPLLNYNELLVNLKTERKMTEAYYVTLSYRAVYAGEKTEDEIVVVMGKIADEWYVITLESS